MNSDHLFIFLYVSIGLLLGTSVVLGFIGWKNTQGPHYLLPKAQWSCIEKVNKKVANSGKYASGEREVEECIMYRKDGY